MREREKEKEVVLRVKVTDVSFPAGLSNPVDTVYHLQPVMLITLLPLAFAIDGNSHSYITLIHSH